MESKKVTHNTEDLLDTDMLQQYIDLVGPQLIYQSVEMFEK